MFFCGGIPAQTKRHNIREFIEPSVKGGLFKKKGHIKRIEILVFKDVVLNKLEYHGLVNIEPDEVAERVIKKLNCKKFMGKHIAVREYRQRDWHNDRRLNNKKADIVNRDRRETDRRRGAQLEEIEDVSAMFIGREGFHRKQGD
ncbi:RNA recognition motif domain-containing protein [Methylomarinum vadi]|uniref:RNA recognition motif domain-containing protein n=1 Tax=Methylomarinum vadi TaxID=438855 RepID=UPI00068D5F54|nr:RNA-binding protein [Methylomarinum vadi]